MNKYRNQRHRIIKGKKLLRTGKHGDSCQQPPKRKEEDKLGKQGGSGRELSEKEDKLGIQGGTCELFSLKRSSCKHSFLEISTCAWAAYAAMSPCCSHLLHWHTTNDKSNRIATTCNNLTPTTPKTTELLVASSWDLGILYSPLKEHWQVALNALLGPGQSQSYSFSFGFPFLSKEVLGCYGRSCPRSIHHLNEFWGRGIYASNANAAWDSGHFLIINPKMADFAFHLSSGMPKRHLDSVNT